MHVCVCVSIYAYVYAANLKHACKQRLHSYIHEEASLPVRDRFSNNLYMHVCKDYYIPDRSSFNEQNPFFYRRTCIYAKITHIHSWWELFRLAVSISLTHTHAYMQRLHTHTHTHTYTHLIGVLSLDGVDLLDITHGRHFVVVDKVAGAWELCVCVCIHEYVYMYIIIMYQLRFVVIKITTTLQAVCVCLCTHAYMSD